MCWGAGAEIEFLGAAARERHLVSLQKLCECPWPPDSGTVPAVPVRWVWGPCGPGLGGGSVVSRGLVTFQGCDSISFSTLSLDQKCVP